jgi:hypothetical protein
MRKQIPVMILGLLLTTNLFAGDQGWNKTPTEAHPYFAAGKNISGKIDLGSQLLSRGFVKTSFKFDQDDVLYVIARKSNKVGAPPVAVVRIDGLANKKFPVTFKIGPADLMMDDQFIGPFSLKVKLSRHGGATTSPGDFIGYSSDVNVKMGSSKVKLLLTEIAGEKKLASNLSKTPKGAGYHAEGSKAKTKTKTTAHSQSKIHGVVDLSSEMKTKMKASKFKFKKSDVLFIIAKKASSAGNQPVAVVRIGQLDKLKFPVSFSLGSENMMMGDAASFKGPFLIKAKLSRSGGVSTQKGDLFGEYKESPKVALGSKSIKIKLNHLK